MRVFVLHRPDAPHAHAGQVLDLPDAEATDMILSRTAIAAPDDPPAALSGDSAAEPDPDQDAAAPKASARASKARG